MTATFGKLENKTLTFQPGLNVIHAPNEWGKSTWCAFLLNMLYGIDTKERTKQDSVADKDRYAPWSGAPMSGRIDLCWNGRDITIERSSNQRVPLGLFRAYETATGIDIPELNASNCGQVLLGVERNVFVRAGFLKLADLPVTQDDALRRRLNNLVTTGDESDDADKLRQALRDLKNKCRSNRSNGLIPEAEAEHARLKEQLWELQGLEDRTRQLQQRRETLEAQLAALENHKTALNYLAAKKDAQQVAEAKATAENARQRLAALEESVKALPTLEEAQAACQEISRLQAEATLLLRQQQQLPEKPAAPVAPPCFTGMNPDQAMENAQQDTDTYRELETKRKKNGKSALWIGVLTLISAINALLWAIMKVALTPVLTIGGIVVALAGGIVLLVTLRDNKKAQAAMKEIRDRYPGLAVEAWVETARQYASAAADYENRLENYRLQTQSYAQQQEAHDQQLAALAGEESLAQRQSYFEESLFLWNELAQAQRELEQTQRHADTLAAMAKTAPAPSAPDTLTHSPAETDFLLAQTKLELQKTGEAIAQNQGQMDALGQPAALQTKLEQVSRRIARLETYNAAIELAQDNLYKISLVLQRRFSPRITKRAQELFSRLTGGRYQRITLGEDMGLEAASVDEVTLRELRRRSDGTIDQLYLALRLAVAEELTPALSSTSDLPRSAT